ncbi:hypothetical protein Bhyg_10427 [Pseudolycoriella hygida]|uniref:Uncharacterized protein n=1 Tax=Pseudolycoriella hygida TaxID=35572 RepID=A0A9Q0RZ03_9DIPT|nr:hypothetical protein Bhyg_10427 [Pseudolycoriella hygida]
MILLYGRMDEIISGCRQCSFIESGSSNVISLKTSGSSLVLSSHNTMPLSSPSARFVRRISFGVKLDQRADDKFCVAAEISNILKNTTEPTC